MGFSFFLLRDSSTIPPDVLTTAERPDLVFLDRNNKSIDLYEPTCSFKEKEKDSACLRKRFKEQ